MAGYKERGKDISIAAVLSWIPLVPVFWFLVKPVLILAVTEAVADDIQEQVKNGVAPVNNAFAALMRRDISSIRKEISGLKFKRDNTDTWTSADAEDLVQLEIDLDAAKEALEALEAGA
jgi:hypothetical protein